MPIEGLTLLDLLFGSFGLIFMIVSIIIGLKIVSKYFTYKLKATIPVGLTWLLLSTAWWGAAISFVLYLIAGTTLSLFYYLLVDNIFLPIALLCWIYSFATIMYPQVKRKLLIIYSVICLPYEVLLLSFLIIDPELVGTKEGIFNSSNDLFVLVFLLFSIATALITGILFARKSMQSEDPNIRWKGRFLLIAFIFFTIAGLLDAGIPTTPVTLIIARSILISSAFLFYLGFFLPEKLANKLGKRE
ncbi:MAG: hypothetical protein ACTSU4_06455 [Promethearchaeota archaeon]